MYIRGILFSDSTNTRHWQGCLDFNGTYFLLSDEDIEEKATVLEVIFPMDIMQGESLNYGLCDSEKFFKEFNSDFTFVDIIKKVSVIYVLKLDLSNIKKLISPTAKQVIVQADSVYMSKPLDIDFDLTILARTVSIDKPLKMLYREKDIAMENQNVRTLRKSVISYDDKLKIKRTMYGRVEILAPFNKLSEEGTNIQLGNTLSKEQKF